MTDWVRKYSKGKMLSYKEQEAWRKLYREGRLEEMWLDNRRLTMEEVRDLL